MRDLTHPKKKFPIAKIIILSALAIVFVAAIFKFFNIENYFFKGPKAVVQFVTDSGLKSENGRVNVLILGTGGAGHDGPDLSDTIIFASVDKDAKDVVMVSIPRDLWAPDIKAKINHAYAYGEEDNGNGLEVAKDTISKFFGLPVHYAVRVDFDGFIKAVDEVGGIDMDIETAFQDPKYPVSGKENDTCGIDIETKVENGIKNTYFKDATQESILLTEENDPFTCRYETLTFQKGPVHIDGITALKFARSRHGTNSQGSDFSRSARQQQVILAFRQKVLSTQTLLNPKTIIDLASTFGRSIDTNVTDDEIPLLIKLGQKIDPQSIRTIVLDSDRDTSALEVGDPQDHGGQYVLVPKHNSWTELAEFVQGEVFKNKQNPPKQKN